VGGGKTKTEMGAVLPCGMPAGNAVPAQGKAQPTPPAQTFALQVHVQSKGKNVSGARVTVAEVTKYTAANGIADFGKKEKGKFNTSVSFKENEDYVGPKKSTSISLSADTTKKIEVQTKNYVTPKVECEYSVVLLESKNSDHQGPKEKKIETHPTRIQISVQQTDATRPLKTGGRIECAPANVSFFLDEKCLKPMNGNVTHKQLNQNTPFDVFLRGKTEGKFNLKFTLDDTSDPLIVPKDNPTEQQEMGVVKLELKLHFQDLEEIKKLEIDQDTNPIDTYYTNLNALAWPEQKLMTPPEKTGHAGSMNARKPGRLLHVQKGGNHGRAKLILSKINPNHIPAEADNYSAMLECGLGVSLKKVVGSKTSNRLSGVTSDKPESGELAFFDKEFEGTKVTDLNIKFSDLKTEEKTFYVEGVKETDEVGSIKLDLGMDREPGGIAKKPKRNGDWARFTIVKVEEEKMKLKYKAKKGKPEAWDEDEKRFYINFKDGEEGRKIKIRANLTKKLEGIPIYFMLSGDKDNRKQANWGMDMPGTWDWSSMSEDLKQKDKDNRKDLLHLKKETDKKGKATMELVLPRFGGEKYTPACYVQEDYHLCKYIQGHTELEKKKPVLSKTTIEVWRKFWYRRVVAEGFTEQSVTTSEAKYKKVKATLEQFTPDIKISKAAIKAMRSNPVYPEYMVKKNGGNNDVLVISDINKGQFYKIIDAKKLPKKNKLTGKPALPELTIPIILCDAQWDNGGTSGAESTRPANLTSADFPISLSMDKLALDPPLQGGNLLASGSWQAAEWSVAGAWENVREGDLSKKDVTIDPGRASQYHVQISLPAAIAAVANTYVWLDNIVINGANGVYLGESAQRKILAVCGSEVVFNHVITHEIGHAFNQTPLEGQTDAINIPKHPHQYVKLGSHCGFNNQACVMHGLVDSNEIPHYLREYCPNCHPYLIVEDFSEYK
jgi:hypothetical protein